MREEEAAKELGQQCDVMKAELTQALEERAGLILEHLALRGEHTKIVEQFEQAHEALQQEHAHVLALYAEVSAECEGLKDERAEISKEHRERTLEVLREAASAANAPPSHHAEAAELRELKSQNRRLRHSEAYEVDELRSELGALRAAEEKSRGGSKGQQQPPVANGRSRSSSSSSSPTAPPHHRASMSAVEDRLGGGALARGQLLGLGDGSNSPTTTASIIVEQEAAAR